MAVDSLPGKPFFHRTGLGKKRENKPANRESSTDYPQALPPFAHRSISVKRANRRFFEGGENSYFIFKNNVLVHLPIF
jgi:hypothetical protein